MAISATAAWRPDVAALKSQYAADIKNVLYGDGVMIPVPALVAFSQAVSEQPNGGITARKDGLVHIFVGTASGLWKYDSLTNGYTSVSQLGANQAVNGTFAADVSWSKGAGVTIAAGVGTFTAVANGLGLTQAQAFTAGTIYKVTYTVSGFSAGGVAPALVGGTTVTGTTRTANGTYTDYLTAVTGNITFGLLAVGATTLNVDNVTVFPMEVYTSSVDQRWRFRRFGDFIVAVNINDAPQYYELGVSTEFSDLPGSPPNAHQLAVWGDHLALFSGSTVTWSDTADISNWTTGNSGSQTFQDGGDIQGSFDATNPLIVQREAIRAATFQPGSADTFSFTKISDKRGAISPYAVGTRGEYLFFADTSAFFQLSANGEILPVGFEKVDRYSFGLIGGNDPNSVYCEVDPVRPRVYFAVKSNTEADSFDRLLVLDWQIGEWSKIETTLGILFPLAAGTIGQDLDTDVPDDPDDEFLDTDAPSLDSSIYESGAPLMAAFDTDFRLGFFNGANAEAYIETSEMGEVTGQMRRVTELYPAVDAANLSHIHVSIGTRNRRSENFVWTPEYSPSTNTGICRKRSRARFQKYRLRVEAAAVWTFLQGMNDNAAPAGMR